MDQQYDNTNSGAIFKNDQKGNAAAPNYKGKINVDGKEKQIALWFRESKNGVKFFSVKISEPYVKASDGGPGVAPEADDNDGLPF